MSMMLLKVVLLQTATTRMCGSGNLETAEVLCYPRNFSTGQQVAFQRMKKQHVVCGHKERPNQRKSVEVLTWCQQMGRQC